MGDGEGSSKRWPEMELVAETLRRIRELGDAWNPTDRRVWSRLQPFVSEAGWTEEELIEALIRHFDAEPPR